MTRYYDIDAANARIPEVRETLLLLVSQRAQLIGLRDRLIELRAWGDTPRRTDARRSGRSADPIDAGGLGEVGAPAIDIEEARLIRLRMRGIVDQMGASVARIDGWGITLRDIETGLIDFPALVNGRPVWLCWRLGEDAVEWWHEREAGVAGRRRLADLE